MDFQCLENLSTHETHSGTMWVDIYSMHRKFVYPQNANEGQWIERTYYNFELSLWCDTVGVQERKSAEKVMRPRRRRWWI